MKKYNVIYADPPWSYDNRSIGGRFKNKDGSFNLGGSYDHYEVMNNEAIINMPIRDIIDKNSVCFLWATVPLFPEAMRTLSTWGFDYKTMLTWRKVMSMGMGYWFRGQTEHLLLGVKGKVKPFRLQTCNFYQSKAGKHSQKPHYFRELINKAAANSFENPVKLELFARSRKGMFADYEYEGWDVYGNEVNNSIQL